MKPKKPTPKELEKFVKPFCATLDPMHNFDHIKRIKRKVAFLKRQYKKLDKDFLNFLIYFHSSRKWAKKNKARIIKLGYPASWVSKINKPTTPEGKIVWDANCLENVGKFGIKKTLTLEKHIADDCISPILVKTYTMLQRYNNNYRPIMHLESFIFTLINAIHGYSNSANNIATTT